MQARASIYVCGASEEHSVPLGLQQQWFCRGLSPQNRRLVGRGECLGLAGRLNSVWVQRVNVCVQVRYVQPLGICI